MSYFLRQSNDLTSLHTMALEQGCQNMHETHCVDLLATEWTALDSFGFIFIAYFSIPCLPLLPILWKKKSLINVEIPKTFWQTIFQNNFIYLGIE